MEINLAEIRKEYTKGGLKMADTVENPFKQFEKWLEEAVLAQVNEPTAMIVATSSPGGKPSVRTVLLKELKDGKFIFYTNYHSRKGHQLEMNPYIALTFVWHELERQVHIEGKAEKVSAKVSDEYFKTRPYKSKIGARISPQSQPISSRTEIMANFIKEAIRFTGWEVERPEYWGGFAVTPSRFEFWQGRENRLHDRILYSLEKNGMWKRERLAP